MQGDLEGTKVALIGTAFQKEYGGRISIEVNPVFTMEDLKEFKSTILGVWLGGGGLLLDGDGERGAKEGMLFKIDIIGVPEDTTKSFTIIL